jgi:hypothetical protein
MEVSASAYYAWVKTPEHTDKTRQKAVLEVKARQLFDGHKQTYGYRRLSDALGKVGLKSDTVFPEERQVKLNGIIRIKGFT